MTARQLSAQERMALSAVRETIAQRGYPPTVDELARVLHVDTSRARELLAALREAGRFRASPGGARVRQLEVVPDEQGPTDPQEDTRSDTIRGLDLLVPLTVNPSEIHVLVVDGAPASKSRPRVVQGGRQVYDPSQPAQQLLADRLARHFQGATFDGNVALGAVFFRPNRQRIDVDNMFKLVLDAGTGAGIWADDSQVTAIMAAVEFDPDRPRTIIAIAPHRSTLDRRKPSRICAACGSRFFLDWAGRGTQVCSPACRGTLLSREKKTILGGGGERERVEGRCQDCGRRVSKPSYIRCRDCWRVARAEGIA